MAFNNNYFTGGYQPTYNPINPVAQQQQVAGFFANEIRFMTEDEIRAYWVAPNYKICGVDREKMTLFIKSADQSGNPSIEAYKMTRVDNNTQKLQTPEFDLKNLVTRGELNNFVTTDRLNSEFIALKNDLKKQISSLKKTTAKKSAVKKAKAEVKDEQ